MAKISNAAKDRYSEKISEYKKNVADIQQREKQMLILMKQDPSAAEFKKFMLADDNLTIASYYIIMHSLSLNLLGVKNENSLNEARKCCYKAIIYLEEIYSPYLDVPFSEYEDYLSKVESYPDKDRFAFINKLGFVIDSVIDEFGENSKWKWSFVELQARLATLSKNCMDLKRMIPQMDPRHDGYEMRLAHFRLTKQMLQKSADDYRLKYELSTKRIDDFKKAIHFLSALRRLALLTKNVKEIEELKKKIEIWVTKMETDIKQQKQKKA